MKEKLKEKMEQAINSWNTKDIYALSLFLQDEEDDPLKPTITFGYNTEEQYQKSLSETDELEARWNFAFWLQNSEFIFGEGDTAIDIKQWMDTHGFLAYGDDLSDEQYEELTNQFVGELIDLVKNFHEEGILTRKFGQELPIIIHELEYYDEIAEQNKKANGAYLPDEFVAFCIG